MVSRVGAVAGFCEHVSLAGIVGGVLISIDPAMASDAMGQGIALTQIVASYNHVFIVVVLFKVLFILFIVRTWQKRRQNIRHLLAEQEGLREQLAREQERSRMLMALSTEWLFQCNVDQQITACSPEFQRIFGREAMDTASQPLLPLHPDDKALFQTLCAQAQRAQDIMMPHPALAHMRLRAADGQWHDYELKLAAVGQPNLQFNFMQYFLGVVRPVQA